MILNEKHHAYVVLSFYKELKKRYGAHGVAIFIRASQMYGEERGRRMALRALRDGNSLNYPAYFAYSEWESTDEFYNVVMTPCDGYVDERVTLCPWATIFREEDCSECGTVYCKEIDAAIVRGFNPALHLDTTQTQHDSDRCQFYFRDKSATFDVFEQEETLLKHKKGSVVIPFAYHCGHVYTTFCNTMKDVLLEESADVIASVNTTIQEKCGEQVLEIMQTYSGTNFMRLPE